MNGMNVSWHIFRENHAENIECTDLMRTRKAVDFIKKYDRASEKQERAMYNSSIDLRLAYAPPCGLQVLSRLFEHRTNFIHSRDCRANFLESRVCKPCENPRQRSLSAPANRERDESQATNAQCTHPGGPQKIMFSVVSSPSPEKRRVLRPVKWAWPTNSSNVRGRSLSARRLASSG